MSLRDEWFLLRERWDVSTSWRRTAALAFAPIFVVLIWSNLSSEEELLIRKTVAVVFGASVLIIMFAMWRDNAAKRRNARNTLEGIDR